MRDFNFFSEYISNKQIARKKTNLVSIILLIVVILIGGSYALTEFMAYKLNASTSEMKRYLESAEIKEKLAQVESKNKQIEIINEYIKLVDIVDKDLERADILKINLISDIEKQIPPGIKFKTITLDQNMINIEAFAYNNAEIAELQHNLSQLGQIQEASVGKIQKSEGTGILQFDIQCKLKDVIIK